MHFSTTPFGRGATSGSGFRCACSASGHSGAIPVEVAHLVGAGHGAHAAADAAVVIHQDNALFILVGCLHRADPDAGRVVAVLAGARDQQSPAPSGTRLRRKAGPRSTGWRGHLGLVGPGDRRIVLHAAGCGAALAGEAFVQVDHHSPTGHDLPPENGLEQARNCGTGTLR